MGNTDEVDSDAVVKAVNGIDCLNLLHRNTTHLKFQTISKYKLPLSFD
jgi:hypothetical protein